MTTKRVGLIFTSFLMVFCLFGAVSAEKKPILIGSSLPLTGPYATTGQEMKKAFELAVEETNAAGGLLGRPLKIIFGDVRNATEENVMAVGERLIGAGVDVVMTGWDSLVSSNVKVYGQYDVPYLAATANTTTNWTVAEDLERNSNIFDTCWDEMHYAVTLNNHLFEIPKEIGWTPPNKKIALLKVDLLYTIRPADKFKEMAMKKGYEFPIDEISQFGKVDWSAVISKIAREKPSYILLFTLVPEDMARFMIQFDERFRGKGIETIIVGQYGPSIPEFRAIAKKSSEDVIWMGINMRENEPKIADYFRRWEAKYGYKPVDPYSMACRDTFEIWAQAVRRAGCVDCYKKIHQVLRESYYQGMWGMYVFRPDQQAAIYGEWLIPVDWVQIRNNQNLQIYPKQYAVTKVKKPYWFPK